ncbi:MAG: T9SS type A sorting domain-containing protein [Bacteroidetes bacterium]|nr:T9SS type A sorting domain-containing protein [Bacteroidota bacterium]
MNNKSILILSICLNMAFLRAQTTGVSLHSIPGYNQWGWNSIVMQNEFITIATVPAIGGRVMQYDLDSLPSIYINKYELGKTYTPANRGYHNFGGYKTWPSPQYRWPGQWPPPPTLDYGNYTFTADSASNDSVSVLVTSPVEQWIASGIQFERRATIYPGSSRVKMEQTIINQGTSTANWGMWSITQSIVNHPGKTDYENYRAYFPLNPSSVYGAGKTWTDGASNAWKGEISPGIYGVQFYPTPPSGSKIFSDSDKGWLAYAVASDTVVFARTFDIYEGAHYPDSARLTVYVSNFPAYMEIEAKFPLMDINPGERYTFTENWWTAKVRTPIIDVNSIGAVAQKVTYDSTTHTLSAVYGVFHKGIAKAVFKDETGQVISEGREYSVSPLKEIQLNETITIPQNTKKIEFQIYNPEGGLIGILDSTDIGHLLTSVEAESQNFPLKHSLSNNYPNPFNPKTVISYKLKVKSEVELRIFDILGREIATLVNEQKPAGTHTIEWDGKNSGGQHVSGGVYFCCFEAGKFRQTHKLILLK